MKNEYQYKEDYLSDLEIHDGYIVEFDAYEAMLTSRVYDSVSRSVTSSGITDSYAATLAMERSARVVGKLPTGQTIAAGKSDTGKALLLDIIRQKWVYPNANAQRPFFEKLRMWQLYSSVYGYMPMFYDWNVSRTGYIGPDCWLWNPRNLIPQQGRTSISDMDYVTALSWVGKSTLEKYLNEEDWDKEALTQLIALADNETTEADAERATNIERTRTPQSIKKGILLATRYEAGEDGRWITFAPDHSCLVLRDIPNPHKNGKIPFVIKYSQPLFDSFYALGDFQRAKPLQFARDGVRNFYFASLKRNLAPGIIVNANGVLKHTLDVTKPNPVLMETITGSIRPMPTNTAGLSTYQAAMSDLTGSLLSLYGTQNASIPGAEALNPTQGKTPAAVNMYNQKEATRDGQERAQLEQSIEELTDAFNSLLVNIGTEDIPINLLSEDIEEIIQQGHRDILDIVQLNEDQTVASLIVNPETLRGVEYRFNITPNSTAETTKEQERQEVIEVMSTVAKLQNLLKDDPSVKIEWGKMMQAYQSLVSAKGISDFITIIPPEVLEAQRQQEMQMQMEMEAKKQALTSQPPEPTSIGGNVFTDPDLGAVAKEISSI